MGMANEKSVNPMQAAADYWLECVTAGDLPECTIGDVARLFEVDVRELCDSLRSLGMPTMLPAEFASSTTRAVRHWAKIAIGSRPIETLSDVARRFGVNLSSLHHRVRSDGMPTVIGGARRKPQQVAQKTRSNVVRLVHPTPDTEASSAAPVVDQSPAPVAAHGVAMDPRLAARLQALQFNVAVLRTRAAESAGIPEEDLRRLEEVELDVQDALNGTSRSAGVVADMRRLTAAAALYL